MKSVKSERYGGSKGFTLIELIVSISIILLMSGMAIAAFTRSREKGFVETESKMVSDVLQATKRRTLGGEKPTVCAATTLDRYEVRILTNGTVLQVWAICGGSSAQIEEVVLSTVVITSPASGTAINFYPVTGGVSPTTIEMCGSGYEYQIIVTQAGSISLPIYADSC